MRNFKSTDAKRRNSRCSFSSKRKKHCTDLSVRDYLVWFCIVASDLRHQSLLLELAPSDCIEVCLSSPISMC